MKFTDMFNNGNSEDFEANLENMDFSDDDFFTDVESWGERIAAK